SRTNLDDRIAGHEHVDARSEPDEPEARALRCLLAILAVIDDAPRDQSRDLPHENWSARGCDSNGHLLVLEARLVAMSAHELAGIVVQIAHFAVDRKPIDVHVE